MAIVTIPFRNEGRRRIKQAANGIAELEKYVDSLLVINNERIREMYGDSSIKFSKYLRLIIHLTAMKSIPKSEDRLATPQLTKNILGLEIPVIRLPVAPGRNLAVMAEAAVRNHLLMLKDYNATDDLIERQQESIQKDSL